jgi:hypothetical protein
MKHSGRLPELVRSIARPIAPRIAPEAPAQSSPTYHYRGLHSSDGPVEATSVSYTSLASANSEVLGEFFAVIGPEFCGFFAVSANGY